MLNLVVLAEFVISGSVLLWYLLFDVNKYEHFFKREQKYHYIFLKWIDVA